MSKPYKSKLLYIESTGTQYIDTGVKPDFANGDKVEISFYRASYPTYQPCVFGSRQTIYTNGFYVLPLIISANGPVTRKQITWASNIQNYIIAVDNNNIMIDDSVLASMQEQITCTVNMTIFALKNGNETMQSFYSGMKLYYWKYWKNGVLTQHLIPVMDNNNVPCLYDKVSNQFFYNAGTGNFLYEQIISRGTIPFSFNPLGITKNTEIPTEGLDFYCPYDTDMDDVIGGYSGTTALSDFEIVTDSSSNIGEMLKCYLTTKSNTRCLVYNGTANMFQYGTGDFTISFWMQSPNWREYLNNCILSKKASDSANGFVIFRDSGIAGMQLRCGSSLNSTSVVTGKWVHWMFIKSGTVGSWYKNGILDSTKTSFNSNVTSDQILRIGWNEQWLTKAYYNLKALRIYNRSLTNKQIKALADEFDVKYYILANNQTFDFYPYPTNQSQQIQISTALGTSGYTFSYQIISGTLPSGLTLNSSNGYINGYVNVDADTNYNLVVRVSSTSTELLPKDVNVTIVAHKETILTVTTPQTFNFTTQAYTNTAVSCNTNGLVPTVTLSDNLPSGVYLNVPPSPAGYVSIYSIGTQTSAESSTVTASFTTQYHPTPVTATLNINIALNQITTVNRNIEFFTGDGVQTAQINYTSDKPITPVYTLTGTLPTGITFDSATGTFTYDGTTTTADTAIVTVEIASSTGHSASATASVTLNIVVGSIKTNLIFNMDFSDGLYDSVSHLTGTNNDTTHFKIMQDETMNTYLHCTQLDRTKNLKVYWNNSQSYLAQYLTGTNNFSVSFWLRCPNWNTYFQLIMGWKYKDANTGLVIFKNGITQTLNYMDARLNVQNNFYTGTEVANSSWVHWVFVRDTDYCYWYRNGVLDNTIATDSTMDNTPSDNLRIGSNQQWTRLANYDITKIRIYYKALSSTEIGILYNNKE